MLNFIDEFLCFFESCFSWKAAFRWFVTITLGLILRSDKLGLTSIIRDLALWPDCYLPMLHFFRASSWSLEGIRERGAAREKIITKAKKSCTAFKKPGARKPSRGHVPVRKHPSEGTVCSTYETVPGNKGGALWKAGARTVLQHRPALETEAVTGAAVCACVNGRVPARNLSR